MKPLEKVYDVGSEALITSTLIKCSLWAPRRMIVAGVSFSIDAYPYLEGIIDSRAMYNWIMKGAQTGLSTGAQAISLFEVDFHRKDLIYYFPTKAMAEEFSSGRIGDSINESPYLKQVVSENSIRHKKIGNRTMYLKGANSEVQRKGTSAARLFIDELDEWQRLHIEQVKARLHGQRRSDIKVWGFSTPKLPDLGIDHYHKQGTQEVFTFPCPCCTEAIDLEHDRNLYVDEDNPENSVIYCHLCEGVLPFNGDEFISKPWLVGGWWQITNHDVDPKLCRSFYVPQIYSPARGPLDLAISHNEARYDPDARREYWNSVKGLPYNEDTLQVRDVHIDECIKAGEGYRLTDTETIPNGRRDIVTLGIDQGGGRDFHHWVAIKWLFDKERHGDHNDRAIGKVIGMGRIMVDDWDSVTGLVKAYQARMTVIDAHPNPTGARAFARRYKNRIYLCYYVTGRAGREIIVTKDETYGAPSVKVDKASWLSKTLGRILATDLQLPRDTSPEFREQIKAPVRTFKKDKTLGYVMSFDEGGRADHYAHAANYAEIALTVLSPPLHAGSIIHSVRN